MAYYIKNDEHNGIEIYFGGKPSDDILEELKLRRWKWYRQKGCWYNRASVENEDFARFICGEIELQPEPNVSIVPLNKKKANTDQPSKPVPYKRSKYRMDENIIERDLVLEASFGIKDIKLYCYQSEKNRIRIIGEVFAQRPLIKPFCLLCTLYDKDGDIIEASPNSSYGSGLVTSMIKRECFFDGFPIAFYFLFLKEEVVRIKIVPATDY